MKRVIAVVLALAMLLSLTAVAFANGFAASAEKTEIKAGETLEVAFKINEAIPDALTLETQLTFNGDLFTVDVDATKTATKADAANGASMNFKADNIEKGADSYLRATLVSLTGVSYNAGDVFAKLVVKAKDTITETTAADFKAVVTYAATSAGKTVTDQFADTPVSFTVTVAPAQQEVEGYSVAAGFANGSKDTIVQGEKTQVALTINNKDKAFYNAFDLTVTYDTAVLTYEPDTSADMTVTDNNGTLRITGYGDDKTFDKQIVLNFTGKAVGAGAVTVTSAKVDEKNNAIAADAPEATILTPAVTVTVGGYPVTLPTGFTGAGTATPNENYTFTATDPSKKYDFTGSTMGDSDVTVKDNGDGTYTVENVTGALVITATEIAQQANVTWSGDALGDLFNASVVKKDKWDAGKDMPIIIKAQMNDDGTLAKEYVLKVNGETVTLPEVSAGKIRYTISGATFKADETVTIDLSYKAEKAVIKETGNAWGDVIMRSWGADGAEVEPGTALMMRFGLSHDINTYTLTVNGTPVTLQNMGGMAMASIPGNLIVAGENTLDFNSTVTPPTTAKIIFSGEGADDVIGGKEQDATIGEDFKFAIDKKDGFNYVVKLDGTVLEPDADGKYTISGDKVNGDSLTITIEKTEITYKYTVAVSQYVQLDGKVMWLVTATSTDTANVLTYDSNAMYWSDAYNAYAWLVISDKAQADVQAEAEKLVGNSATAKKTSIDYTGDVNISGVKDINDAQLVWNMYNTQYADFTNVSMEKFLRADVNKDKGVNTDDAAAIIDIIK